MAQVWFTLVSMILLTLNVKYQQSNVTETVDLVPYPFDRQRQAASVDADSRCEWAITSSFTFRPYLAP